MYVADAVGNAMATAERMLNEATECLAQANEAHTDPANTVTMRMQARFALSCAAEILREIPPGEGLTRFSQIIETIRSTSVYPSETA